MPASSSCRSNVPVPSALAFTSSLNGCVKFRAVSTELWQPQKQIEISWTTGMEFWGLPNLSKGATTFQKALQNAR